MYLGDVDAGGRQTPTLNSGLQNGRSKTLLAAERIIRKAENVSTQVLAADRRKANHFNDIRLRALDSLRASRENKRVAPANGTAASAGWLSPAR
jgi:hypothetical protein